MPPGFLRRRRMATVQITAPVIHKRKVLKPGTILTVPDDITQEEAANLIRIEVAEAAPVDTTTAPPGGPGAPDAGGGSAGTEGPGHDQTGGGPDKVVVPEVPEERLAAIIKVIGTLEADSEKHFTTSGLPRVEVIEDILGYNIDAAERNEAWEMVQEADAIAAIEGAETIEALEELWDNDEDRETVLDAYDKRDKELKEGNE